MLTKWYKSLEHIEIVLKLMHAQYQGILQTPTHSLKEISQQHNFIWVCHYYESHVWSFEPYFWTISYSNCQNLVWWLGVVWFLEQNCSPKLCWKLIFVKYLTTTAWKCQCNQSQSCIQCRRVTSRYRGKWRREWGLVHVYGKLITPIWVMENVSSWLRLVLLPVKWNQ